MTVDIPESLTLDPANSLFCRDFALLFYSPLFLKDLSKYKPTAHAGTYTQKSNLPLSTKLCIAH
jgi:hypothetical protein